jgi:hypothetical protein
MGLDQYVYFLTEEQVAQRNSPDNKEYVEEDFYYRKHNRLQGWMENLYRSKGGDGDFNCVDVELTEEDLIALQHDIESEDLPETGGFFFGNDSYEDYRGEWGYYEKDKEFVEAALDAVASGKKVIYSSWW